MQIGVVMREGIDQFRAEITLAIAGNIVFGHAKRSFHVPRGEQCVKVIIFVFARIDIIHIDMTGNRVNHNSFGILERRIVGSIMCAHCHNCREEEFPVIEANNVEVTGI